MTELTDQVELFVITKTHMSHPATNALESFFYSDGVRIRFQSSESPNGRKVYAVQLPPHRLEELEANKAIKEVYRGDQNPSPRSLSGYGVTNAFKMWKAMLQPRDDRMSAEEAQQLQDAIRSEPRQY